MRVCMCVCGWGGGGGGIKSKRETTPCRQGIPAEWKYVNLTRHLRLAGPIFYTTVQLISMINTNAQSMQWLKAYSSEMGIFQHHQWNLTCASLSFFKFSSPTPSPSELELLGA